MQKEMGHDRSANAGRLVLGLDTGCSSDSDLPVRIGEQVDKKLGIRNLRDPEVEKWCEQTLGDDNRWVPTLFEVEDGRVRAWSGWRMGWVLSRALGPTATWRVMQVLREAGAVPEMEDSAIDEGLPEDAEEAALGRAADSPPEGPAGCAGTWSRLRNHRP